MQKINKEGNHTNYSPSHRTTAPILSEVFIQLPKPQPTKKVISHQ